MNTKKSNIPEWFSLAFTLCILVSFLIWCFYSYIVRIETPKKIKLSDCTNSITKINLKVPKGRHHILVLAISRDATDTNQVLGRVSITKGSETITNFPVFSSSGWMRCDFLRMETNCAVEVEFIQRPPPSTSIWLHWLQTYKDRDKSS